MRDKPEVEQLKEQEEVRTALKLHFRASENTWLGAIVRYLVHPKESGRVKTRLMKKLLDKLSSEPRALPQKQFRMRTYYV